MFIGNAYPEELARLISATESVNMGHCQDQRFNLFIVHFIRFFDFCFFGFLGSGDYYLSHQYYGDRYDLKTIIYCPLIGGRVSNQCSNSA